MPLCNFLVPLKRATLMCARHARPPPHAGHAAVETPIGQGLTFCSPPPLFLVLTRACCTDVPQTHRLALHPQPTITLFLRCSFPPPIQDVLDEESPTPAPTLTSAAVKARKISDSTRKTYKDRMGHLQKYLVAAGHTDAIAGDGGVSYANLTPDIFEKFLISRGTKDNGNICSTGHLNKYLNALESEAKLTGGGD